MLVAANAARAPGEQSCEREERAKAHEPQFDQYLKIVVVGVIHSSGERAGGAFARMLAQPIHLQAGELNFKRTGPVAGERNVAPSARGHPRQVQATVDGRAQ